ncbi:carboxymuconolactone decarboxylase family protein [Aeromonas dhakensis]
MSQQKLDCLAGWRVSDLFSERERAALAWAETLTYVHKAGAPDERYAPLKSHFSDREISDLTLAAA